MQPPGGSKQLHKKAWMVVCIAAINAMDCGRKRANELRRQLHIQQSHSASHVASSQLPQRQSTITQFFQPVPLTPAQLQHRQHQQQLLQQQEAQQRQDDMDRMLLQATQQAVAKFWQLLSDFVILNPCPARGFATLPHDHPFICLDDHNFVCLAPRHHLQS
jgi:C4-dicarboxylate-specific signal transduction histidine kinase